jgi:hypothetical protein
MSDTSQPNIGNDDDALEQATKGNKADKPEVTTVVVETKEEEKTKDSEMESLKKAEAKRSHLIDSLYEDSPSESSDDDEDVSPATKKQRMSLRDRREMQTGPFATSSNLKTLNDKLGLLKETRQQKYGGLHIVFTGDFSQLEPVSGKPLYYETNFALLY